MPFQQGLLLVLVAFEPCVHVVVVALKIDRLVVELLLVGGGLVLLLLKQGACV
jgi:hypothetical protein